MQRLKKLFSARIAQSVEHDLAKVGVAGSSPVSRSILKKEEDLVFIKRFYLSYKISFSYIIFSDARVVEMVDTLDLKSNGPTTAVRVQVPLRVP